MPSRSFLKKNLLVFALLAFVYIWYFASHINQVVPQPDSNKTLGAATNISLFTQPESGQKPIVDAINGARNEVLVEIYLMSDKKVIKALKDAKLRGVDVKVMLEQHPFGGGGINNTTKKELEKMGLSVSWANPNYSLTHEKSIVIDGEELFILTQNLTTSAFSKNREYDVLDTNPEDVSIVRQIFLNDWNRSNYSPPSSNLLISPINSRARIENLIKDGASKIDIEIEEIVDEKIIALVCEKEKSSEVRLIIPPIKNLSANKKASDTLTKCGASVRFLSSPYPHAKLILVDNDKAYIGSINLSKQSMDENRELGIILVESNSIVTLYSTFEKDWKKASKE